MQNSYLTRPNPYKLPKGYLQDPTDSLYTNTDYEISKADHIQEIISEVEDIQETIAGDMDLDYVEFKIKHNKLAFISTGCWLWKVRTYKTYKKTHKTFAEWCEEEAHITYSTALRLIKAATVWIDLASMGFEVLPTSISQCLALWDIPKDELYEAWATVLDEHEKPHHITSTGISKTLFGDTTKKIPTKVEFPVGLYNALWLLASKVKATIVDIVAFMFHEMFVKVPSVEESKVRAWEEDLQDLISNHDYNYVS